MRHRVKKIKLSRSKGAKKALLRNLATSVILEGKIKTTLAKAKATRPFVERLVSIAKKGDLAAKRRAIALLPNKKAVEKLFSDLGPKFASRNGGFLRIINLGFRQGDSAKVALLEFWSAREEKAKVAKESEISEVQIEPKKEEEPIKEESKVKETGEKKDEKKKKTKK
jgi:large subunit ribosomal protein L17